MARDVNGNYTLPLPDVITGDTIEASWANATLTDIATELTDSLSRTGSGGMQTALTVVDGTVSAPGWGFVSEANSGFYRAGAGDVRFTILGNDSFRISSTNGPQAWTGTAWASFIYDGQDNVDLENLNVGTKLTIGNTLLATDNEFYMSVLDTDTPQIYWGTHTVPGDSCWTEFDRTNGFFFPWRNKTSGAEIRCSSSGDFITLRVDALVVQTVASGTYDANISTVDSRGKMTLGAPTGAGTPQPHIELTGNSAAVSPGTIKAYAPEDVFVQAGTGVGVTDATLTLQSDNIFLFGNANDIGVYLTTGDREIILDNQLKFLGVPSTDPAVSTAVWKDASNVLRISDGVADANKAVVETTVGDVSITNDLTAGGNLVVQGSQVDFSNLPTTDPAVAGRLWNDSGTVKISAG